MVDIHQQGDHRIILGDSLKDGSSSHIGVKYNWIPKEGFKHSPGIVRGTNDELTLAYNGETAQYDYTGWISEQAEDAPQLALIYDQEQSVYVLEKIAASLNVNIKSGTNLSSDYIKRHAQLPRSQNDLEANSTHNDSSDLFEDGQDDSPDPLNPFDYRNFLQEAKEAAEKQSSRTPLPGGRTPMSGLSSPQNAGGNRFSSTTPQFGPIEIQPSSKGAKEEYPDRRKRRATSATTKSGPSRKAQSSARPRTTTQSKQPQALSQEKVLDSDSDDDASADMSDRPSPAVVPAKKPINTKTHHRNVSSTSFVAASNSPRITVNDDDDDGGLEIDTGSPPPDTRKKNYRIDPEAFRSQTGTPKLGRAGNAGRSGFDHRPQSRDTDADIEMRDAEEDEVMKYLQSDDEDADGNIDRNGDVDELVLDDPGAVEQSPPSPPLPKPKAKRRQSSTVKGRRPKAPLPPTLQQSNSTDDDDGGLAAELEAALEREQMEQEEARMQGHGIDDEEEGGIGLGIGHDEEEDISEEE